MFTKEKVVVLKIIQNAYCASFQFMKMQSNLLAPESALNWLRHLLFYEVRKLHDSNVLQIGIDHTLEISEKEIKKADFEVDYACINFLSEWQVLSKWASTKEEIIGIIKDAYNKSFWLLQKHDLHENFILFEFRHMLCRQMAKVRKVKCRLEHP